MLTDQLGCNPEISAMHKSNRWDGALNGRSGAALRRPIPGLLLRSNENSEQPFKPALAQLSEGAAPSAGSSDQLRELQERIMRGAQAGHRLLGRGSQMGQVCRNQHDEVRHSQGDRHLAQDRSRSDGRRPEEIVLGRRRADAVGRVRERRLPPRDARRPTPLRHDAGHGRGVGSCPRRACRTYWSSRTSR